MTTRKKYAPMSAMEADAYLGEANPGLDRSDFMLPEVVIYAELLRLHERIDEIENQAQEMMSPEKMMDLASGFMGMK